MYETLRSTDKYKGLILSVRHDVIALPDGREGVREVVVHAGGAAVLPVDDDGRVYLVRQHRQPAGKMVLEIPAGMLEQGETAAECAARELGEEVGFQARAITPITESYCAVGFCTAIDHIFVATGLTACERKLDDEEFIETERYTADEALAMVKRGEITDGKTLIALMAYRLGLY